MSILSQKQIQDKYLPLLREEGVLYIKYRQVLARKAKLGEKIYTFTADGLETKNTVDSEGYIVQNKTTAKEEYFVTKEKFAERYEQKNPSEGKEWKTYLPIGKIFVIELSEQMIEETSGSFIAPWGEEMVLKVGDYLVCPPDFSEIYRIAKSEFAQTYVKINFTQETKYTLKGEINKSTEEKRKLAKKLKKHSEFYLCYRIHRQIIDDELSKNTPKQDLEFHYTQSALCVYKNKEASVEKFDQALAILQDFEGEDKDLSLSTNYEVLGLAGAIYKYKWMSDNQIDNLHTSLSYYQRGYELGEEYDFSDKGSNTAAEAQDWSYTSINAAYVNDLLAYGLLNEHGLLVKSSEKKFESYRDKAEEIRTKIDKQLDAAEKKHFPGTKKPNYWWMATVFEARLALGQFEKVKPLLKEYKDEIAQEEGWKRETTASQIATTIQIHDAFAKIKGEESFEEDARNILKVFLDNKSAAVDTAFRGKVGLALSGGGFRAALYHIGVLANLAENGILRHIEVISCVSGGSIVGAMYYLKLREAIEDLENHQKDFSYVSLVKELQEEFLTAVQTDIRGQIFADWNKNVEMIASSTYNRASRLAELYDKHFYQKFNKNEDKPLKMKDLEFDIKKADGTPFDRHKDNWSRERKVPLLVINATTMNTGHNWQFTSIKAGEPPAMIRPEYDAKYRIRRMNYEDDTVPRTIRNIKLSEAVGASSAVPGVFNTLILENVVGEELLKDTATLPSKNRPIIQLSDGGVYDNQGISSLLEQNCDVLILSDAGGQMPSSEVFGEGELSALKRASDISMERIREAQYLDLMERKNAFLIKDFVFVHLKKGIVEPTRTWEGDDFPREKSTQNALRPAGMTDYKINQEMQKLLAAIRTDLDSFHHTEAYALMYSGYQMMSSVEFNALSREKQTFAEDWKFKVASKYLEKCNPNSREYKLLEASSSVFFKNFKLRKPLAKFWKGFVYTIIAVGFVYYLFHLYTKGNEAVFSSSFSVSAFSLLIFLVLTTLSVLITRFIKNRYFRYKAGKVIGYKKTFWLAVAGVIIGFYQSKWAVKSRDKYNKSGSIKNVNSKN